MQALVSPPEKKNQIDKIIGGWGYICTYNNEGSLHIESMQCTNTFLYMYTEMFKRGVEILLKLVQYKKHTTKMS